MYPADEPGIAVRRVTVEALALRVVESGPRSTDAVVLVHGWGASVYSFAETIPALAAAGHYVVALDLPGHGLSDKPSDERRYTTRAHADVVIGAIRVLDIERFTLVGHSMGGGIALYIACRGAAGLTGLVLLNAVGLGSVPLIGPVKLLSPRIVDRFTPRLLTRRLVRVILGTVFAKPDRPTERDVNEYWAPSQFREYAWACRACAHQQEWGRTSDDELRALAVPVLVVAGGRDLLVRRPTKRAHLIPRVRVVTIDDGGHLALQECAERVNREVIQFLGDHGKA